METLESGTKGYRSGNVACSQKTWCWMQVWATADLPYAQSVQNGLSDVCRVLGCLVGHSLSPVTPERIKKTIEH